MPRPRSMGAEFLLYHTASNLSRKKCEKNTQIIFPEFVQHYYLHFEGGYGILSLSRGNANWGVNVTPDRRSSTDNIRAKKVEKISISLLTIPLKCAIIRVSRGDGNHFRLAGVQVNEIEKKCKKPLDNQHQMCYNNSRSKGEIPLQNKLSTGSSR